MIRKRYNVYKVSGRRPARLIKSLLALVFLIFVLLAAILLWLKPTSRHVAPTSTSLAPASDVSKNPQIESIAGKYMFSGTVVLDRTVAQDARVSDGYDYSQPFGGMSGFGQLDSAVADLECPVTENNFSAQEQINVDNPKFNCQPGWLPELKKYFPIINLSSNHAYDRGADGFNETETHLQDAGFQVVGNYSPHANKDNCTVVAMPLRLEKAGNKQTKGVLPIAFCSFNYKSLFSPEPGELEAIQRYLAVMPVFGLLNAGTEYQPSAGATQLSLAHKMIDYGAEFVIGNGTHWVQNTEAYKGKLITYSLGNFIFDQADYESRRAANIIVNMSAGYDDNLAKWLAIGKQCQAKPGQCLATAESQSLKKVKLKLSYQIIASEGGYHSVTHVADSTLQKAVEERLDWSTTDKGLSSAN